MNIKVNITNEDQMQIIITIINNREWLQTEWHQIDKGTNTTTIINGNKKIGIIIMITEINKIMDIRILEIQKIFTMGNINGQV